MINILLTLLVWFFSFAGTGINGYDYTDVEILQYQGIIGSPSTSVIGKAKIYLDSTSGKLKCSENGGAYTDCVRGTSYFDTYYLRLDCSNISGCANGDIFYFNGTSIVRLAKPVFASYLSNSSSGVVNWALMPAVVSPSWNGVLAVGRTSSGVNPQLTTTDHLEFRSSSNYIYSSGTKALDLVSDNLNLVSSNIVLSNYTTNGFVKTSGGSGALVIDTSTYLTSAITSLNALTGAIQTFATGTSGVDFNISSSGTTHTFNIPRANNMTNWGTVNWTDLNGLISDRNVNWTDLNKSHLLGSGINWQSFSALVQNVNINWPSININGLVAKGFSTEGPINRQGINWTDFPASGYAKFSGRIPIVAQTVPIPVADGGTATTTAFTAGSLVLATTSGVYTQDNANLFWDLTNHRLGIGTNTLSSVPLTFAATTGNKIFLYPVSSTEGYGFGISGGRLDIFADSGQRVGIGTGSSGLNNETLSVFDAKVGVMTTSPISIFTSFQGVGSTNAIVPFSIIGNATDGTSDAAAGIAMLMTHNGSGNRQMVICNSDAASSDPCFRMYFIGGAGMDSVSRDGATRKDLTLGTITTNMGFGGAVGGANDKNFFYPEAGKVSIALNADAAQTANLIEIRNSSSSVFTSFSPIGLINKYNTIATQGLGVPAIYKVGRATGQTAANTSVVTYTNGATDGTFLISANANITSFIAGTFNVTVDYTDETNTARTLTLNFSSITGTIGIALAAAGPFEGIPSQIRCKASTAITFKTAGTFTSLTYNVEGVIQQLSN